MTANVTEKLHGWFAMAEKRRVLLRGVECILAVTWPIVAYNAIFNRYGWKSDYYNRWGEIWFGLALLIPMVGPLVVRLFSGHGLDAAKRFAVVGLLLLGIALAVKYRPMLGGLTFMGFVFPMALEAGAIFLVMHWRSKPASQ